MKRWGYITGVIFLLFCLLTAGGYFIPALFHSTTNDKKLEQAFIDAYQKTLSVTQKTDLKAYEPYISKKIINIAEIFAGTEDVQVIVYTNLNAPKINSTFGKSSLNSDTKDTKTIQEDFKPDTILANTLPTKTVLVFIKKPEDQKQLEFLNRYRDQMISSIKSIIGYDGTRGDIVRIILIPNTINTIFSGTISILTLQQTIALSIICALVVIFFLIGVPTLIHRLTSNHSLNSLARQIACLSDNNPLQASEMPLLKEVHRICNETPDLAVSILRKWLFENHFQTTQEPFSPAQQTAILLSAIPQSTLKKVFQRMNTNEINTLTYLCSCLERTKSKDIQNVLTLFCDTLKELVFIPNSTSPATQEIKNILPTEKAEFILKETTQICTGKTVWEKLEKVSVEKLATFLKNEYPQTIALILYNLSNEKAGSVLTALPEPIGISTLMRLTALKYVHSNKLRSIESDIEQQFFPNSSKLLYQGYQKASAILSLLDFTNKKRLIDALSIQAPKIAQKLSRQIICFDDFAFWLDKDIRSLIKQIPGTILTCALTNASGKTKEAFSRNISPKIWGKMLHKMALSQTGSVKEIDEAQCFMIKKAQEMIDSGHIKRKV